MKRKLITFCIIIKKLFNDNTKSNPPIVFSSIKPNLLIIITSSFGFMRGKKEGLAVGFLSGFLTDVFWGNTLGFYTLLFSVIGYLNGSFRRLFYDDDIKLPIALIAVSELIYGLVTYSLYVSFAGGFLLLIRSFFVVVITRTSCSSVKSTAGVIYSERVRLFRIHFHFTYMYPTKIPEGTGH